MSELKLISRLGTRRKKKEKRSKQTTQFCKSSPRSHPGVQGNAVGSRSQLSHLPGRRFTPCGGVADNGGLGTTCFGRLHELRFYRLRPYGLLLCIITARTDYYPYLRNSAAGAMPALHHSMPSCHILSCHAMSCHAALVLRLVQRLRLLDSS